MQEGVETAGGFVVAGGDATELLEPIEKVLNQITFPMPLNRVLKNSSGLLYVVGQFPRLLLHIVVYRTFSTAC